MIGLTNAFVPDIVGGGLAVNIGKGTLWLNATLTFFTSETVVATTAKATNYIYIDTVSATIQVNTSGFLSSVIPLAIAISDSRRVISLTDTRPDFFSLVGGGGTPNFADAEIPSGSINGSNITFTVVHIPNPSASLQLYLNGQQLIQGLDYTLSGNTITMVNPPQTGDAFEAFYRY